MSSRGSSGRVTIVGNSLDAAALQTEMSKKYGLMNPAGNKKPRRKREIEAMPTCRSCGGTNDNENSNDYCGRCGFIPVVRIDPSSTSSNSLAQRRGLVPIPLKPPPEALKPFDWYLIESALQRKRDPDACCPICMETFRSSQTEVLLSCGHIFHKTCLRSFENFIQSSDISCPICRTKNYQKKVTNLGSIATQQVFARKIQAIYRGYVARQAYRVLLRQYYQRGGGLEIRRRQFAQYECQQLSTKISSTMQERAQQVDGLLQSMDRTLLDSQQLDRLFEEMLFARSQTAAAAQVLSGTNNNNHDSNTLVNNHDTSILGQILTSARSSSLQGIDGKSEKKTMVVMEFIGSEIVELQYCQPPSSNDFIARRLTWMDILQVAAERGMHDNCAICMLALSPLMPTKPLTIIQKANSNHNGRRTVLLSCSHAFHAHCVGNFERFLRGTERPCCPVCRANYIKRLL